jgi:hypothetical protein
MSQGRNLPASSHDPAKARVEKLDLNTQQAETLEDMQEAKNRWAVF